MLTHCAHIDLVHTMQDWLVEALRERMKYFRRNRVPVQHELSTKKMVVAKIPTYQMPHVPSLPPIADGEDEASHDRHVKVLSLEFKKGKPNKHAVAELMKRTFSVRRQRILTAPLSMESLLKTYPPLKQYNQVCDVVPPLSCLLHCEHIAITQTISYSVT